MRFKLIFSIVGFMAVLCGSGMLIPAAVDFYYHCDESGNRFALSAAISVSIGLLIYLLAGSEKEPLRAKEMFVTTTLVWVVFGLLSAIPFYMSVYQISWTHAVFESMSGLTTTGATILKDIDHLSPGVLVWRSALQWLGGAGIVIVALMVLPALRIGGMQLFYTESSMKSERDLPTVAQNMRALLIYFIGLTILCAICLKCAGMTGFDAINHAMTTIATGGFSTHDQSIAYYHNPAIEWIMIFFMLISSLPLILGLYLFKRQWRPIQNDTQIWFFLKFVLISTILLTGLRWTARHFAPNETMTYVREALFSVASVVSTSGFVADNYQLWGNFAVAFFMFLMMTGGCTGSTSGGIKMFRFSVLSQATSVKLKTVIEPHGVFIPRYGHRVISDDILISVLVFFGLYLMTAVVLTIVLSAFGLDFVTAFSAAIACLSNVGPALGHLIGPDKTFAVLPDTVKWILSAAMLIGRLEFVSIFVLFFPFLWRRNV